MKLDEALDEQTFANTTTYILGDVNLDINKFNRSTLAQNYLDRLISKGFFSLITQPTRVTDTFASIIDHIIRPTNDLSHKLIPGIIRTDDLSDPQSWTALFRAFSSHRQPSASLTKLFPSWTRLLAELDKPYGLAQRQRLDFLGVDHEGRQTCRLK